MSVVSLFQNTKGMDNDNLRISALRFQVRVGRINNVGGNLFQVFGVMRTYSKKDGHDQEADLGRYEVTRREIDKYVFKVPSLRNVARTAPYFHDGSAQTLEQTVDVMFKYQLGRNAPQEDKAMIVKFLHTLNGVRCAIV